MRSPEEIKKAMNGCHSFDSCSECPYFSFQVTLGCKRQRNADALALIQQLQDDLQLEKKRTDALAMELAVLKNAKKQLEDHLREAAKKIEQLEEERDAAVAGLKSNCTCPECKYFSDDIQDPCRGCKPNAGKFEWRGVQKEE